MREYSEINAFEYDYYRSGHILDRKFNQIYNSINKISQSKSIKKIGEIGSGTGKISSLLASRFPGSQIMSYEKNNEFVKYAKKTYQASNLSFDILDIDNNSIDENFDIIITLEVLHHVISIKKTINNIYNSLSSTGSWIAIEPNIYNPYIYIFQLLAKNEKNFSQKYFENKIKNFFLINNKARVCLIPSYIKKPSKLLISIEKKLENQPICGGSVAYTLKKINI